MDDTFELTATNTTTMHPSQFNFYNKLSWNDSKNYFIIFGALSLILVLSLLFIPPSWNIYVLRAFLTLGFIASLILIPRFIKIKKLESRGTPFTSIGIDFSRSEIIFRNKIKELYSYSPEKIQSLDIMEISKDASLWSINKKAHFKVPHELHMPHLLNSTEFIIGRRDNRFILKMIAHLFVLGKEVEVSGHHWKMKNLLTDKNIESTHDVDTEKIYLANEMIGSGVYKVSIVISCLILLASMFFKDLYLCILSLSSAIYFSYTLINNPSYFNAKIQEFKDIPVIPGLLKAIKEMDLTTAHMLTVPYNVAHPYSKKKKEIEKILILTQHDKIMIYSSSGENILE